MSFTWLCGGALALNLLLIARRCCALIGWQRRSATSGRRTWSSSTLADGTQLLGEIHERESDRRPARPARRRATASGSRSATATSTALDFVWVDERDDRARATARPTRCCSSGSSGATSTAAWSSCGAATRCWRAAPEAVWQALRDRCTTQKARAARGDRASSSRGAIGDVNHEIERAAARRARGSSSTTRRRPSASAARPRSTRERGEREAEYEELADAPVRACASALARRDARHARPPTATRKEIPVGDDRARRPAQRAGRRRQARPLRSRASGSSSPTSRASRTPRAASSRPSSAP